MAQKKICFLRHAKSSHKNPSLRDHDRPLNKRGKRDLEYMPAKLKELGFEPDGITSSTARRTLSTAQAFRAIFPGVKFQTDSALYLASGETLLSVIQSQDNAIESLLICTHNPGITAICNALAPGFSIDNVPTCGIGIFAGPEDWSAWQMGNCKFLHFIYPKMFDQ